MDIIKEREKTISVSEGNFVVESARNNLRIDGRKMYDFRPIQIEFFEEFGNVLVELGETKVIAKTKAEIITPRENRPSEGALFFHVQLCEMASKAFHERRAEEEFRIEVERLIDRAIRTSNAIDMESLCLVVEEHVWKLNVEVYVLNFEGNIVDASMIAIMTSLIHFRRNDVTVSPDGNVIVHPFDEKNPIELTLHHFPLSTTFAFYEEDLLLVDPSLKEELVSETRFTLVMNDNEEICCSHKPGGKSVPISLLQKCVKITRVKTRELKAVVDRAFLKEKLRLSEEEKQKPSKAGGRGRKDYKKMEQAASEQKMKDDEEDLNDNISVSDFSEEEEEEGALKKSNPNNLMSGKSVLENVEEMRRTKSTPSKTEKSKKKNMMMDDGEDEEEEEEEEEVTKQVGETMKWNQKKRKKVDKNSDLTAALKRSK